MLCMNCWHWWPRGTRYCGTLSCRRSLNAKYCADDHMNPLSAEQTCLTCGKGPLSQGAPALETGCITAGMGSLLLVGGGVFAWKHAGSLVSMVHGRFDGVLCCLYAVILRLLGWWIAFWIGSHIVPAPYGPALRRGQGHLFIGVCSAIGTLFRGICRVVCKPHPGKAASNSTKETK